jgi:hypothetical protein
VLAERGLPPRKAIGSKVSRRVGFSLVRYKNVGQPAIEQRFIEIVVRLLHAAIFNLRDCKPSARGQ